MVALQLEVCYKSRVLQKSVKTFCNNQLAVWNLQEVLWDLLFVSCVLYLLYVSKMFCLFMCLSRGVIFLETQMIHT